MSCPPTQSWSHDVPRAGRGGRAAPAPRRTPRPGPTTHRRPPLRPPPPAAARTPGLERTGERATQAAVWPAIDPFPAYRRLQCPVMVLDPPLPSRQAHHRIAPRPPPPRHQRVRHRDGALVQQQLPGLAPGRLLVHKALLVVASIHDQHWRHASIHPSIHQCW